MECLRVPLHYIDLGHQFTSPRILLRGSIPPELLDRLSELPFGLNFHRDIAVANLNVTSTTIDIYSRPNPLLFRNHMQYGALATRILNRLAMK